MTGACALPASEAHPPRALRGGCGFAPATASPRGAPSARSARLPLARAPRPHAPSAIPVPPSSPRGRAQPAAAEWPRRAIRSLPPAQPCAPAAPCAHAQRHSSAPSARAPLPARRPLRGTRALVSRDGRAGGAARPQVRACADALRRVPRASPPPPGGRPERARCAAAGGPA
eukprot:scaffold4015_cov101-Isochrysis_galbana.AAC.3